MSYQNLNHTPAQLADAVEQELEQPRRGQYAAHLAWRFAGAVENALLDIEHARALVEAGHLAEAFLVVNTAPPLGEIIGELSRPEPQRWRSVCEHRRMSLAQSVPLNSAGSFANIFPAPAEQIDWLTSEFLRYCDSGELATAYPIIKHLAELPHAPQATRDAAAKLERQLLKQAEPALAAIDNEDAERICQTLEFYRSYELEMRLESGPQFARCLSIEESHCRQTALDSVNAFLAHCVDADFSDFAWLPLETQYFSIQRSIQAKNLSWVLPNELFASLRTLGKRLEEVRNEFERSLDSGSASVPVSEPSPNHSPDPEPEPEQAAPVELPSADEAPFLPEEEPVETPAAVILAAEETVSQLDPAATETAAPTKNRRVSALAALGASLAIGAAIALAFYFAGDEPASPAPTVAQPEATPSADVPTNTASLQEFDLAATKLQELLRPPYSLEADRAFTDRLRDAESAIASLPSHLSSDARKRLETINAARDAVRHPFIARLKSELAQSSAALQSELEEVPSRLGDDEFPAQLQQLESRLATIEQQVDALRSVGASASDIELAGFAARLETLQSSHKEILAHRGRLLEADSPDEYFDRLAQLGYLAQLRPDEKTAIEARSATRKGTLLRFQALKTQSGWTHIDLRFIAPDLENQPIPDAQEIAAKGQRLLQESGWVGSVRLVEEQFLRGSPEPSDVKTLLAATAPIVNREKDGSNAQFTAYNLGDGSATVAVRNNLVNDQHGNPWGYRYADQGLCPESVFYTETLAPMLQRFPDPADRLAVVRTLDQLNAAPQLAPSFRDYWSRALFDLIADKPSEFGIALSPHLQAYDQSRKTSPAPRPHAWLAERANNAQNGQATPVSYLAEIEAVLSVLRFADQAQCDTVGFVDRSGQAKLGPSGPCEPDALWFLDTERGRPVFLSDTDSLPPYAPLFTLRASRSEFKSLRREFREQAGRDMLDFAYRDLIPNVVSEFVARP